MRRASEVFRLVRRSLQRRDARMLRHRRGDRGIQTTVEKLKLLNRHRRPTLLRQRGNRLADVAVVVHHLREREAGCEQLRAVPHCCLADRVGTRCRVGQVESKRLLELLEKEGNTMLELADRPGWPDTSVSPLART